MSTMKALVTAEHQTAEVKDIPIPEPGLKEIRVKVHFVALNLVDSLYVAHPTDKPGRVVGSDIAGVVDKVGNDVVDWNVGDRVAGLLQGATSGNPRPGGFAEYAILEHDLAIRIPPGVSFEEAATFPLCSLTAAQALFIRLELEAPFSSPFKPKRIEWKAPTILVFSAATSVGLFAVELAKLLHTPTGESYRIFATASPKNHDKLLALGVEAVFDYKSPTWPEEVRKASGGISYAVDCISEDKTTAQISQTFVDAGGKVAVIRKSAWNKDGIREGVLPIYSAAWWGLGHEIIYNDEVMPASSIWREFTTAFYKFLSLGSESDHAVFPISGNPVRLMPGGLEGIIRDAFVLLGQGKVRERNPAVQDYAGKDWLRPISAEKLVYSLEPL
ncbi:chaperonin 10-like protein [Gymnopilus junonius]|uniref:Chaperonin 10-like protein n=1 Tax=Gymnopilus junonius TaxID=109634 RepID=A0A9P5NL03_GYMJU|nr:chaperonin 10-like protein [Gymnopilus junonius]